MSHFRKKSKQIEAYQWFKNGDHPLDYSTDQAGYQNGRLTTIPASHRKANNWEGEVVRRFNHPSVSSNTICNICNCKMSEHGWIDRSNTLEYIVCPGDWIITEEGGLFSAWDQKTFFEHFEPIPTQSLNNDHPTLGQITFHNDDDSGMYQIGEIDGGFDEKALEQYINIFGVSNILVHLAYMQHQAISIQQKINNQKPQKDNLCQQ